MRKLKRGGIVYLNSWELQAREGLKNGKRHLQKDWQNTSVRNTNLICVKIRYILNLQFPLFRASLFTVFMVLNQKVKGGFWVMQICLHKLHLLVCDQEYCPLENLFRSQSSLICYLASKTGIKSLSLSLSVHFFQGHLIVDALFEK